MARNRGANSIELAVNDTNDVGIRFWSKLGFKQNGRTRLNEGLKMTSTIVSLLSERIMKNGKKFASLFTDLSNSTSNSIYQKIDYTKIGQNIHFDFSKK